jgi:hypothetical protein
MRVHLNTLSQWHQLTRSDIPQDDEQNHTGARFGDVELEFPTAKEIISATIRDCSGSSYATVIPACTPVDTDKRSRDRRAKDSDKVQFDTNRCKYSAVLWLIGSRRLYLADDLILLDKEEPDYYDRYPYAVPGLGGRDHTTGLSQPSLQAAPDDTTTGAESQAEQG